MTDFFERVAELRMWVDGALFALLWWVQLWAYPKIVTLDSISLSQWHPKYVRMMTLVAGSLMLLQVLTVCTDVFLRNGWSTALSLLLVACCWWVTFRISLPCHRAIAREDHSPEIRQRLLRSNWLRTIGWTLVFGLNWL